jgi:hypothetical protein
MKYINTGTNNDDSTKTFRVENCSTEITGTWGVDYDALPPLLASMYQYMG